MRLLVPTDGSPHALVAARLAALLAGDDGALALLHVVHDRGIAALAGLDAAALLVGGAAGELSEQRARDNERTAAAMLALTREALPRRADGGERQVTTHSETGRPADVVLELLARAEHDGVVLGSRGRSVLARALLGSVSDAVLSHAAKPVAIARHDAVRALLVPVDGSEPALRAAALAGELARRLAAPVTLLHAAEFPLDSLRGHRPELENAFNQQAARVFEGARAALGAVAPTAEIFAHDEAAHSILAQAHQLDAGLVVLGRRGQSPAGRRPLGSVAVRVARNAEASVLVVP